MQHSTARVTLEESRHEEAVWRRCVGSSWIFPISRGTCGFSAHSGMARILEIRNPPSHPSPRSASLGFIDRSPDFPGADPRLRPEPSDATRPGLGPGLVSSSLWMIAHQLLLQPTALVAACVVAGRDGSRLYASLPRATEKWQINWRRIEARLLLRLSALFTHSGFR